MNSSDQILHALTGVSDILGCVTLQWVISGLRSQILVVIALALFSPMCALLTAFSFFPARVFVLAVALNIIDPLTLVTNSEIKTPVRSRELVATHLLHGLDSAIDILKVNKAYFLTSLIFSNSGFDEAIEAFEGIGKIISLEILRKVTDVKAAAVVLVHRHKLV